MRRIAIVGMVILAVVALPVIAGAKAGDKPAKLTVCHIPDDGGEPREMAIPDKAVEGHLGHGDILGKCLQDSDLPPVNTPPVAVIDASLNCGWFNCNPVFDGSGSFDSEGDNLSYHWTVVYPDGSAITSSQVVFGLSGVPNGSYEISLTVSDGLLDGTATLTLP